ncbi:MAG: tRNA epoxyqueuosine(34) reductase QueG, partial [Salaquimonas sp.]
MGFADCRFTKARLPEETASRLKQFVAAGHHGQMAWMEETVERRQSPENMWPEVRSAILFAMNYGPDLDPLENLEAKDRATISVYARNRDYHDIVKGRLKQIAQKIASRNDCQVKVFVDTAPLLEKPLAQQAGLGWQGKHTNLVSREIGSWFFIGTILTDSDYEPDDEEKDHCGSCRACLDICPTKAFPSAYQLDARRCISYLTIEHDGLIEREFRRPFGNRIYGCDDCLAACPWNKFAEVAGEAKLQAREELKSPSLLELVQLDDAEFRKLFSGSPIKRIGRNRFIRNVLIAIGNSQDKSFIGITCKLLADADPVIRGTAVWALSEIVDLGDFLSLAERHISQEKDETVRAEWAEA